MGQEFIHKEPPGDMPPSPSNSWGDGGFVCPSVTGQQTAKDADGTTNEQEASSEQQKRIANDGLGNSSNLIPNTSSDSTQRGDQTIHSNNRSL